MWMGGLPSLSYDIKDRKLVINEAEANTVRHIFRRYAELKSVRLLKAELDALGIVSKPRIASDGTHYGERPLARGALYLMLQNRIYRGEIVHKYKSYPGEHEAIVNEALWSEVQAILTENRADRMLGTAEKQVIRCSWRADDSNPCDQEQHSLSLLYFAVATRRDGEALGPAYPCLQSRGACNWPHPYLVERSNRDAQHRSEQHGRCRNPETVDGSPRPIHGDMA
jgi:hypothetical protein